MKISDDQNIVEHEGIKGEFVELEKGQIRPCKSQCVFYSGENVHCEVVVPCGGWVRKDGKNGYFRRVE